ncbi:metallothionein-1X isoform X1 [Pongo pygmaeus]|uniref:metallothionein-1X isoform X1 n=1 Tax=Pongo pygmaeus TaxID=9600 RepID=UPI00300D98E9
MSGKLGRAGRTPGTPRTARFTTRWGQRGGPRRAPGAELTGCCTRPRIAGGADSAGAGARTRRGLCARPSSRTIKGAAGCCAPLRFSSVLLRVFLLIGNSCFSLPRNGPQLLLLTWWFLCLRRLLQMQRVQMHLLQEE